MELNTPAETPQPKLMRWKEGKKERKKFNVGNVKSTFIGVYHTTPLVDSLPFCVSNAKEM